MRAFLVLSSLLFAGSATIAAADTVSSTSGAGASVAIVSGSNGGTTIVVDSEHPCRTRNEHATAESARG